MKGKWKKVILETSEESSNCEESMLSFFSKPAIFRFTPFWNEELITQPAITCSKLTIETLEQGVEYVQS